MVPSGIVSSRNSAMSQVDWTEFGVVDIAVLKGGSVAGGRGVCCVELSGGCGVSLGIAGMERLVATMSVVMALTVWAAAVRIGSRRSVGVGVGVGLQAARMIMIRTERSNWRLFMARFYPKRL